MENLNKFSVDVHQNAVEHGWWDEERSFGDIIALCHSELSEALEEFRSGRPMVYCEALGTNKACMDGECGGIECLSWFTGGKPEGIAVEMADCIIRILDWCGKEGIDIEAILDAKHAYNKTRPYRHGGKAL